MRPPGRRMRACLCDGAIGMQRVMQRLRKEDEVDGSVVDGDLFHVAEAVVDILDAVPLGLLARELDHLCGGIDGDDAVRDLCEKK